MLNKENLIKRGTCIDTDKGLHNRICCVCGKIYSPSKIIEQGIKIAHILLVNYCSRKCYEKGNK